MVTLCALSMTAAIRAHVAGAQPATTLPTALSAPPENPDPNRRYLFYLHGRIIEDKGRRPTHPRWGVYEYDQVLEALAATGAVVISEQRPPKTRPAAYARRVSAQVRRLLAAGVAPQRVGVVGFSKGGWIAHLISARLKAPIRYVMLAMCPGPRQPTRPLHGHVLSIRERSDGLSRSCDAIFSASPRAIEKRELLIDIGGGHGAFYRPHDAWLAPLTAFLGR